MKGVYFLICAAGLAGAACGADWPQYRGVNGTNVAAEKGLPAHIDVEKNLAWKAQLPGRGASTPIAVDRRIFVTASSGVRQDRLHTLCFDAESGKLLWERQLWATGKTLCHPFGNVAACTPASDGKRVFAFYSSNDLACFDMDGNLQWFRGLGLECPTARNDVGMASSPLVVGRTVIVQAENQGESFAEALDTETGQTRWRLEREHAATWTSPFVLRGKTPKDDLVLLQSKSVLSAHDPATGREVWQYPAQCHTISTGVTAGNTIFLPADPTCALRQEGTSVVQLWEEKRLRCDPACPIADGKRLYLLKGGIFTCVDPVTAKTLWQVRLKGPFWGTPLVADGRAYAVSHDGLVQIVDLSGQGKLLGTAQLDKGLLASPIAAAGGLFFRSDQHLWKFIAR